MQADRLNKDGAIGIICTSHVADMERYGIITATMERLGYKVVLGRNIQKNTFGYAASAEERASDLNAMVADKSVQMVLFGGGESAVEILPYIDYENIRRYPKLFSSYSDGTSILNAIYAQTGLLTYYGCGPGEFADLRYYDYTQFISHFIEGCEARHFARDSRWKILCAGSCDGILIGGYAPIVGLMLSNKYFNYDGNQKYILFLEDHEKFSCVGAVSTYLAFIEQSEFINNVAGLIFGHYSPNPPDALLYCLERFGRVNNIPVVYTDDFGHGVKHGILPIGAEAHLDSENQSLIYRGFS
ncbi:S66 peptidase family protein [Cuneatibacter caecimuris]|uniref:Muramoyltetrapeptide carboxypeptidase n=1 Tax=Cuneatibacter caecimuris TaxID=1796618 RepID=A0A4Q7P2R2_9FIRM|nr:LD-carboxypeptidase [Cuneatibacter caecimuris]RZS94075.1 muramoyltetrapeptide carboxypeptidase [Cuneatibacter caecimuris]